MVLVLVILGLILFASLVINLCLVVATTRLKHQISSFPALKESRQKSIELHEFLSDMLAGDGLIAVNRVDPNNLYTVSPRDKI